MTNNQSNCEEDVAMTSVVDSAVGVSKPKWYVAIVKYNSEKICSENLSKLGITNYVPIQTENRIWKNGRKATVDRVVIPATIFIHCTEQKRLQIVRLPFIFRFMTNKAGRSINNVSKPLAIIPDHEIERLKFMLGQSDIPVFISQQPFKNGDKVRVIRGDLAGLEGEVLDLKNERTELIVSLQYLGCARLSIETSNLELISSN